MRYIGNLGGHGALSVDVTWPFTVARLALNLSGG
jgi:hypothetical protein